MSFRLYYPVHTLQMPSPSVNQPFGANPQYYQKFHDANGNPLKGHDGIDFYALHGTPVHAAHDGMAYYQKDSHGGEGIWVRSTDTYPMPNGNASYYSTVYWHLIGDTDANFPSPIPLDGKEYPVKAGDLIGYADNTGAPYESSGTHLHFGLLPGIYDVSNGFNGRIDPAPFFTGTYADAVQQEIGIFQKLVGILTSFLARKSV